MNNYINDYNETVKFYFKELKKKQYQPISKAEEKKLIIDYKENNNEKAKNKLVSSNLRFVFNIAKKYKGYGVDLDELIAVGNYGLLKALDKFNLNYDVKFISYAVWWIKQSIEECVKKNNARKSVEILDGEIKDKNEEITFNQDTEDELVEMSEMLLPDTEEEEKKSSDKRRKYVINKLLSKLDERSKGIVQRKYGFLGKEQTLEEVGEQYSLSKERVRQVLKKSLHKLRAEALILN